MYRAKKFITPKDGSGGKEGANGRKSAGAEGHCPVKKAGKPVGDLVAALAGRDGTCPRRQETGKGKKRRGQQEK